MGSVVIMGAGPAGLAMGMLLSEDGIDVTVLDKDPTQPPGDATDAWEEWQRPGVAQFHQPHGLLPSGREIMENRLPAVLERLRGLGAHPFNLLDSPPPTISGWSPLPGDERYDSMAARRPIYELAFALGALDVGLNVRRGVAVARLSTGSEAVPGVPHITGVETGDGEQLEADLVIDAGGRRSPMPALLDEIGAQPMHEEAQDSRFVYYTRFYRKREDAGFPDPYVMSLFRAGSITILTVPGDNDTWGVTIFATTSDKAMRVVRDTRVFERVIAAHPLHAHWLDGVPITDITVMAGVADRERSVVVNGSPVATGVIPISDAWACTNPSLGRGITMALMHISDLAPVIVESLDKPTQLVGSWLSATESRVQPWHAATLRQDRRRNREMDAVRTGLIEPSRIPSLHFDEQTPEEAAFFIAMLSDPEMLRAAVEMVTLYASPEEVTSRPEIQKKLAAVGASLPELPPLDIPTRSELEHLLA